MRKLTALVAFLGLSVAYAQHGDAQKQGGHDPAAKTEQVQVPEQGVIKQKKATAEEEATKQEEKAAQPNN